jgi:hypothetical protein
MDMLDVQFETYIDTETGQRAIRIKQTDDHRSDGKLKIK